MDASLLAALDEIACQVSQFCERRRTEDALHASEARFRHLADAMPQMVWTAAPDGKIDYCNERFYELTGLSRELGVEQAWHSVVYSDDQERVFAVWAQSAQTGVRYEVETRLVNVKTETIRWYLVRANAINEVTGEMRWYGTCTDIDDQKRNLEELRISEERMRALVAALPLAVYTIDQTGIITLFNEPAVELWGRRPEIGKDRWCGSWKLYRPDGSSLPLDQCPMAVTLREGCGVRDQEIITERPDGSRAYVLPCPEPIRDAAGKVVGAVNILFDLTDRKQLEDQFRQSQKMEAVGQTGGGSGARFQQPADDYPGL